MTIEIGIIGGSGLYDMAELTDREEKTVSTPFGEPSGPYLLGTLRGKRVAFLARRGQPRQGAPNAGRAEVGAPGERRVEPAGQGAGEPVNQGEKRHGSIP